MGYSIMTQFNGKEEQKDMLEFLSGNYRTANKLTGKDCYVYSRGPVICPAYTRGQNFLIGFDYNGGGIEREYAFQVCSWMAKMAGKRRKFEGKEFPFIIYDAGAELIVIAEQEIKFEEDIDVRVVDEFGFCASVFEDKVFEFDSEGGTERVKGLIMNELERLTREYKKR